MKTQQLKMREQMQQLQRQLNQQKERLDAASVTATAATASNVIMRCCESDARPKGSQLYLELDASGTITSAFGAVLGVGGFGGGAFNLVGLSFASESSPIHLCTAFPPHRGERKREPRSVRRAPSTREQKCIE